MSVHRGATATPEASPALDRRPAQTVPGAAIVGVFTVAAFTGSGLPFLVQPKFARFVLTPSGRKGSMWSAV